MGVPTAPEAGSCRWRWVFLLFALFLAASRGPVAAFKVATPYSLYVCPEGQNVTLTCRLLGPVDKGHDVTFYKTWYRSSRGEVQTCSERRPIRNLTFQDLHLHHGGHQAANTSHDLAQRHGLESASDHHGNFSITMHNLTLLDNGLYCCLVVEIRHHHWEHRVHGAMELQVQTGKDAPSNCMAYPSSSQESESKAPSPCPCWALCSLLSSSCTQTLFGTLASSTPGPPPLLLQSFLLPPRGGLQKRIPLPSALESLLFLTPWSGCALAVTFGQGKCLTTGTGCPRQLSAALPTSLLQLGKAGGSLGLGFNYFRFLCSVFLCSSGVLCCRGGRRKRLRKGNRTTFPEFLLCAGHWTKSF
ncbi:V-type immunoglobulin domain-containing suppressor of T-cell activation isoform X3 [Sapajus apella]|uniref:V-type immunoglobulin domain-containing suppressor of T-cell activation isoform X3 n=1 Tax=Sapajus apella TaxID=9515 RepID=UPI001379BB5A|nr:V-type immunoglobulin domain-containing suppressor of T-cell activation isoform X3 [Sapajus apella]